MTDGIDPRVITWACSMVKWSPMQAAAIQLVRAATIDHVPRMPRVRVSQREGADLLHTDPRQFYRTMMELTEGHHVLDRDPPFERGTGKRTGTRPLAFWLTDPRTWRGVRWRFPEDFARPGLPPLEVLRRLEAVTRPSRPAKVGLVTRWDASLGAFATRSERVTEEALRRAPGASLDESLLRAPGASLEPVEPSSTERGATGAAAVMGMNGAGERGSADRGSARDGNEKEKKTGGAGWVGMSEGAEAVAAVIALVGPGPVLGKLRARLAQAFEGVTAERARPIVAKLYRADPSNGTPGLVEMACQTIEAGGDVLLDEAGEPISMGELGRRLSSLRGLKVRLEADLRLAVADVRARKPGWEEAERAAEVFGRQLEDCHNGIAVLEEWREFGLVDAEP